MITEVFKTGRTKKPLTKQALKQQLFDQLVNNLLEQGRRCVNTSGRAVITNRKGDCDPYGFLLSHRLRQNFINKESTAKATEYIPEIKYDEELEHLVYLLQQIHDKQYARQWKEAFGELASEENLIFNIKK